MNASEKLYSEAKIPRQDRPMRLGSLLFTIVEPRPGHELAYNRWYERDHFLSGCMIGAFTLAGGRFVATRPYKALRLGAPGSAIDPAKGSYLALYWILDGEHAAWDKWAVQQVTALHGEGRMFSERDHIHTGFYRYEAEYNAAGSSMPIELALNRHYAGTVAILIDLAPGKTVADADAFFRKRDCPGDVALLASPMPMDPTRPADVPDSAGRHCLFLSFSTEDPQQVWAERYIPLDAAVKAAGLGEIRFASPFIPTVFGTDKYVDEI
jgi:hypothetical protein